MLPSSTQVMQLKTVGPGGEYLIVRDRAQAVGEQAGLDCVVLYSPSFEVVYVIHVHQGEGQIYILSKVWPSLSMTAI